MSYICYRNLTFKKASRAIIATADKIAQEYAAKGYDLTLRQLYYQFVARGLIENTERSYKRLGSMVNNGRLAGLIDWQFITDRTRELRGVTHWGSPAKIIEATARSYALDKWKGQPKRPEVWIEKDALVGVISGICEQWDVDYFSCRGYTSQSEMWRAAMRMIGRERNENQTTVIIHLGDLDPSGVDMSRDIEERLWGVFGAQIEFVRIALSMEQVEHYKPPPNPTKLTDSRAGSYLRKYGDSSWELDALPPDDLSAIVDKEIQKHVDERMWMEVEEQQEAERELLKTVSQDWPRISRNLMRRKPKPKTKRKAKAKKKKGKKKSVRKNRKGSTSRRSR